MKKIKFIILLSLFLFAGGSATAQELNCQVDINTSQIEGVSKDSFNTLMDAINDYMNNTQFTNAQFSPSERIDCKLFFVITEYTDNENYSGTLQIQSNRPVYNTSYNSTMVNFRDNNVAFTYQQGEPLIFNQTHMESNLTAILNFWAYFIIAMDFDSFSPRGGDPWFDRLQAIVQMGQTSGETGWKAFDDNKNRAAVLAAFTDPATVELRDMNYQYHRKGLDEMALSPDKGRKVITDNLPTLTKVNKANSMSVGLSMFRDAKLDELVNLYSKAPSTERTDAYNILEAIYPTETQRLDAIKKGAEK